MSGIDVLIITALELEYAAAQDVALSKENRALGVAQWEPCDISTNAPYLRGSYIREDGTALTVALARPTRMGATSTLPVAAALVERLKPRCLAMCGVCAGNPSDVALGDVIIAETTYPYDEGKVTPDGFQGDHRQSPMLDSWVRAAQEMSPEGLPSYGPASDEEARMWLLERLYVGDVPRTHPARARYFPAKAWESGVRRQLDNGLIQLDGESLKLTDMGRSLVAQQRALTVDSPGRLPFKIKVGPMASGNVVVKDGITWEKLAKWGVRSVLGLEMEAAAIGSLAHRASIQEWVVVKGVMDHADPRKDDRHKTFAARASAEVLFRFLSRQLQPTVTTAPGRFSTAMMRKVMVIGGVTGETAYPSFEDMDINFLCTNLGRVIAKSGAELIVCSPFSDALDVPTARGYVEAVGRRLHFHSPKHAAVAARRSELAAMLGAHQTKITDWGYPGPETEEAWGQAWLLCQLQAMEHADALIAIGGRVSKNANTLLHLAEARGVPVVPFAFLGGAAQRAYQRRQWSASHPDIDHKLLLSKSGIEHAIDIANQLAIDRISSPKTFHGKPESVFISRASKDSLFSRVIEKVLLESNIECVLGDHEVQDNRTVQASIEDAMFRTDVCAVLWSGHYAQSSWCYDELELALDRWQHGSLRVWLLNLDGSSIVPRAARKLPQVVAKTPADLERAVRQLLNATPSVRKTPAAE